MRVGVSEEGSSRVLDAQEFIEDFEGWTTENALAVISMR